MAGADRLTRAPAQRLRQTSVRALALTWAITASLLAHAWLLSYQRQHGSPAFDGRPVAPHAAMTTRIVHADIDSAPSAPPPPTQMPAIDTRPVDEPPRPAKPTVAAGASGTPATSPPASLDEGLDEYLPRRALTRGPTPEQTVFVAYPEGVPPGRWQLTLTLFIDAHGIVQHVRLAEANVPQALEDAARQAFLQTSYRPGEVKGQPVKSRIRIEIEFNADTTPASSR